VLDAQYDEENSLHELVRTGGGNSRNGSARAPDQFVAHLGNLRSYTRDLGMTGATVIVDGMLEQHRTWERDVNAPLLSARPPKDAARIEARGTGLLDQLRGGAANIAVLLGNRITAAQQDLVRRINETIALSLLAFLVVCAGGVVFVRTRRAMFVRLERERHIIETLQKAFRTGLDPLPGSRVGTAYLSATRDASVGGDLFDVRRLDENRGLVTIADISGKGIEAAVNTAFVKYSIRTLALSNADPAVILSAFNGAFLDTIKDPNLFVVAFVGILDARTMQLTYASAGHSGAFLRRGGDVTQLDVTGPVVGVDRDVRFTSRSLTLQPRDLLVLATDGLTEARDRSGAVLDDAGAIRLVRSGPTDPQACADELVSAIRRRSGGRLADDLALLVIGINEKRSADASAEAAA
jgi:stage II sporulation SpoE-like protein